MNYVLKYTSLRRIARTLMAESGKARANEVERTPNTNDIVLFKSPAKLQHERERPDMERKYMNSDTVQRNESE